MADFEIERPSVDVQPIQPTYNINTPSFTIEINGSTPGQRGEQGPPGQDGRDGVDGINGINGIDGQDGVSVTSIEQTTTSTESGGTNIITATLSNGDVSTFEIMNGLAGTGIKPLESPIIIQELEDGLYLIPSETDVYGVQENAGDIQFTTKGNAIISITHDLVSDAVDPDTKYDVASYYVIQDASVYVSESEFNITPTLNTTMLSGAVCDDTGDEWSVSEFSLSNLGNVLTKNDVIDNLTSSVTNKPLSAAQGKALKDLLDAIVIPTNTSDLNNDSGFITSETDPVYSASAASGISSSDISNWNSKSNFSGSYNDLTDKPTLFSGDYTDLTNKPTIPDELSDLTDDTTHRLVTDSEKTTWSGKQDALVSGTNIKTINSQSLLGSGNIDISGGGGTPTDVRVNGTSITSNDVADIQVDGTYNSSTNKIATMSSLPTKVSDLSNDTGFITNTVNNLTNYYTKTNTYTKSEVDSLISAVSTMDIQVVQTLPTQDISTTTIYLVPKTASTNDAYDEYIYVNNSWEHIGSTEVDLSNYYTKTETDGLLDDKADLTDIQNDKSIARGVEYIIGTQTAATNLWTGVSTDTGCSDGTLYTGKVIIYHLPHAGTSTAATLNLTLPDGTTTGAKSVYRLASTTTTTNFVAGCDILMVYDGSHWKINAYVDTSGSNTIGYQLRTNNAIFANKTGYAMNRYTLLFEVDGGLSGAATTIGTGTSKTTVPFKYIPGGVIKYYATSGSIANNSDFTATGLWDQYTLNLGYTFNTGSTLTSGKPVYMRCVVNSDGTLTPNYAGSPSHPIVQDLPTTEDGYVYVFLGQAYNTTNIELMYMHRIYEYKNGKIREYVDATGGVVTETDPIFTASAAYGISSSDITAWNGKSNFSGSYNDLTDKPTIPTVNDATLTIQKNGTTVKTFTANASSNVTANITVPTQTSELTNNSGYITKSVSDLTNYTPTSSLATVATSGSYNDLTNKPTIPTVPTNVSAFTNDSGYITGITSSDIYNVLGYYPAAEPSIYTYSSIRDITSISNQTYIGLMDDITNDIPIVISLGATEYVKVLGTNNGNTTSLWYMTSDNTYTKITLTVSGTSVTVTTEDIEIPTKTSDLTNDSNFAVTNANNNFSASQSITGDLTISGDITNHVLDLFNDTSGSNWQDMMKNKLDYCIANINTTKTNIETFINGGWSGVNYGFGVFSKLELKYQLVWYSTDGIYYCRKLDNGVYDYRSILWTNS